jgi:hypothetical protein
VRVFKLAASFVRRDANTTNPGNSNSATPKIKYRRREPKFLTFI